jgi:hypothetical protein
MEIPKYPMPRKIAVALLNTYYHICEQFLNTFGKQPPLLFLIKTDPESLLHPRIIDLEPYLGDSEILNIIIEAYQDFDNPESQVVASIFVTEAWMLEIAVDSEEGKKITNNGVLPVPSDSPDKREVLMFMLKTRDAEYAADAEIDRSGERAKLKPLRVIGDEDDKIRTRFGRLVD